MPRDSLRQMVLQVIEDVIAGRENTETNWSYTDLHLEGAETRQEK